MSENKEFLEIPKTNSKILVIDDDILASKFLAKKFEKKGYNVTCLNNETLFNEYLTKDEYDLVILDWKMPKICGIDILKSIRENKKSLELPIIMVTANDQDENVIEALKAGANDYLVKPVNMEVAFARVQTQLDLKALSYAFQRQKEMNTVNAMIATYNHEINNPLTIALGYLNLPVDRFDDVKKQKTVNALNRIAEIVKKIEEIDKVNLTNYPGDLKILKLGS